MSTIFKSVELTTINCGKCGGIYAINERYRAEKQDLGGGWHCPYCECGWGYFGETEAQRLQRQLDAARSNAAWYEQRSKEARAEAEHFRRSRDGIKGVLVKVKRRVKNGVCPCCHRTFQQLARHMEMKHPGFAAPGSEQS